MDVARCRCIGTIRNIACPFHGDSGKDPKTPYRLSDADKELLTSMRIAVTDTAAIEEVRKLDENRFRERN